MAVRSRARQAPLFVLVSFGLLMGVGLAIDTLSSGLGALATLGGLLVAAGWIGLSVSTAIYFRTSNSPRRPPIPPPQAQGGFWMRRRTYRKATRKIGGKEPYREDELNHLRWLATRRAAARPPTPAHWLSVFSLTVFFAGLVLRPPEIPPDFGFHIWGTALTPVWPILTEVTRIVAGTVFLVLAGAAVVSWRMRDGVQAKAFLERTRPVDWPLEEGSESR